MKVYIAGKITGNPGYKEQFAEAERHLRAQGHTTMNPAVLPDGFEHHEYMQICFSMIDVCDAVYFLGNWRDSVGATMERNYAINTGKVLVKGGTVAMKINLPDIEIQPDWTIPSQVKKIGEEYGEVAEAVAMDDPVRTIKEALDTMQTCATLINMVLAEWKVPLDRFLWEHEEKLAKKGYMGVKIDG